ncbi:hypothetical protein [Phaeobacter inhibens]|uniref:hypothetical protein n=1 Tax=Phaeobacter inhibens TaxID=221822 RepID=UPI0021A6C6C5|nr:hypothetical protein [Phaeobacter inhibens]UWR45387.1 hypothetical protein K4F86_00970 [Phaeobacter inhibens]
MPDADFDEVLRLSREDVSGLIESLAGYARTTRQSGKTWFEHILDRLEDGVIGGLDEEQLFGMVTGICEVMDTVLEIDNVPRFFAPSLGRLAGRVVGECLRRLNGMNPERHHKLAQSIAAECSSINWIVGGLLRTELFHHGHAGNGEQRTSLDEWVFSEDLLQELLDIARKRISDKELQDRILAMPDVSGFMYGWRDMSGDEEPKAWVLQVTNDDEVFLKFLQEMRGYAVSDRVYYPLHRRTLEIFFEDPDAVVERLDVLTEGEHATAARDVRKAIRQARNL